MITRRPHARVHWGPQMGRWCHWHVEVRVAPAVWVFVKLIPRLNRMLRRGGAVRVASAAPAIHGIAVIIVVYDQCISFANSLRSCCRSVSTAVIVAKKKKQVELYGKLERRRPRS
jgi:hypothetical protein